MSEKTEKTEKTENAETTVEKPTVWRAVREVEGQPLRLHKVEGQPIEVRKVETVGGKRKIVV